MNSSQSSKSPSNRRGGKLHVPARVADFAMAEVRLDEAEVGAALGQVVAARVPERMRVDVQMFEPGTLGRAVEHELHGTGTKSGAAPQRARTLGRPGIIFLL